VRSKARGEKFASANERRATQRRTKSAPSLRAALKVLPYCVAALAKGITLGCTLRLVWRNFQRQRGSRLKREQTLGKATKTSRLYGYGRLVLRRNYCLNNAGKNMAAELSIVTNSITFVLCAR